MKHLTIACSIVLGVSVTACAGTPENADAQIRASGKAQADGSAAAAMTELKASLRNASGLPVGEASARQVGDSIRLSISTIGMRPGSYGAHIHAVGRCDAPDFASAGQHWNPTGEQHGRSNPQGMHKGDLPNFMVDAGGRGTLEINITGASLLVGAMPMMDRDGAAIVIHERPDDYRTDPSGNSGGRMVCGVFG